MRRHCFFFLPGFNQDVDISSQYLDPGLGELRPLCQLLPGINIRVVGSLKSSLQLFKLFCCESGSAPALFPL